MPPKKLIYPVFLPHAGCPFQCIYCNQFAVTSGGREQPDVVSEALTRLESHAKLVRKSGRPGEAAFYGGTFTALPLRALLAVLESAASFVDAGIFTGIRFSTRPDCLGNGICEILAGFPVTTVEIGVQSLSDSVLNACGRGYTAATVLDAAARVARRKWALGIQLMAGLPEDSADVFLESVRRVIEIGPDFVRIYPTIVLKDSALAKLFLCGSYRPLSLDDAIDWVVPAFDLLVAAGIPVARMGLHADPALDEPGAVLAGPNHPAFGYLVRCGWWRDRVLKELAGRAGGRLIIRAAPNLVSDIVGPARSNVEYWKSALALTSVKIAGDPELTATNMILKIAD